MSGPGYLIRPMVLSDAAQAAEIERCCMPQEAWPERLYREELKKTGTFLWLWCAQLLDQPSRLIGTISLTRAGDDGEIGNVAVLAPYRRLGVARALLKEVFSFGGRELQITSYTLEVRAGNRAAIRLYEAEGFVTQGRRPGFYVNPAEDALIMWKRSDDPLLSVAQG